MSEYSTMKAEDKYLFHVTYYSRVQAIAERGLVPGMARAIGGMAYDAHAKNRVFLTEGEGVFFWFSRAEDHAQHNSDAPMDDGLVPVVLRIDVAWSNLEEELEDDAVGSKDAGHDAYFCSSTIESQDIQIWNGERWNSIEEADLPDVEQGVEIEEREEDGEPVTIQSLKSDDESPFYPPTEELFTEYEE